MTVWQHEDGETPIDPSGLKDRSIKTRAELNRVEAENIRKASVKYLAARPTRKLAPFDFSWLCRLHKEMFCDVWQWAGETRRENLNIGVEWPQVTQQLMELVQLLAYWEDSSGPTEIEQAALLHYRAVWIHPFSNGNGRWARMLANIWLGLHDQPITVWPEQTIGTTSVIRKDYLKAIRAADEGDTEPLTEMHRMYSEQAP